MTVFTITTENIDVLETQQELYDQWIDARDEALEAFGDMAIANALR